MNSMNRPIFFVLFFCLSLCVCIQAQSPKSNSGGFIDFPRTMQGTYMLQSTDSVFVLVENNQKFILHKVKRGETLYSIKRFYGIETSDLYFTNPGLEGKGIKENQLLKIPISGKAIRRSQGKNFVDTAYAKVYYRVRPQETLYRIAKVYFGMPTDYLQNRNKLPNTDLKTNQVLHIGWLSRAGIPDSLQRYTGLTGVVAEENEKLRRKYEHGLLTKKEEQKEGVACWPKFQKMRSDDELYVLYSGASTGAIVRIENPMTGRVLYVRVIGTMPHTSFTEGAIVMLSPTVAHALGALDAKTFVKLSYLK